LRFPEMSYIIGDRRPRYITHACSPGMAGAAGEDAADQEDAERPCATRWCARGRVATMSALCMLVVVKLVLDIVVEVVYLERLHADPSAHFVLE